MSRLLKYFAPRKIGLHCWKSWIIYFQCSQEAKGDLNWRFFSHNVYRATSIVAILWYNSRNCKLKSVTNAQMDGRTDILLVCRYLEADSSFKKQTFEKCQYWRIDNFSIQNAIKDHTLINFSGMVHPKCLYVRYIMLIRATAPW